MSASAFSLNGNATLPMLAGYFALPLKDNVVYGGHLSNDVNVSPGSIGTSSQYTTQSDTSAAQNVQNKGPERTPQITLPLSNEKMQDLDPIKPAQATDPNASPNRELTRPMEPVAQQAEPGMQQTQSLVQEPLQPSRFRQFMTDTREFLSDAMIEAKAAAAGIIATFKMGDAKYYSEAHDKTKESLLNQREESRGHVSMVEMSQAPTPAINTNAVLGFLKPSPVPRASAPARVAARAA